MRRSLTKVGIATVFTLIVGIVLVGCGKPAEQVVADSIENLGRRATTPQREAAIRVLKGIGQPAVSPLIRTLRRDSDATRRAYAALALAEIEHTSSSRDSAISVITEALKDEKPEVRGRAGEALGKLAGADAISDLIELLDDLQAIPRQSAIAALSKIGEPAIDPLINELASPKLGFRRDVRSALDQMDQEILLPRMIAALRHENETIVVQAAQILVNLSDKSALNPIKAAMKNYPIWTDTTRTKKNKTYRLLEALWSDLNQLPD